VQAARLPPSLKDATVSNLQTACLVIVPLIIPVNLLVTQHSPMVTTLMAAIVRKIQIVVQMCALIISATQPVQVMLHTLLGATAL
jgi:hypothetical protein